MEFQTPNLNKLKSELQKLADLDNQENDFYPFVQDIKSPIYLSKGKSNSVYFAKIQRVQSKIERSIFDMGNKLLSRMPKEIPDQKFWYQRFYYYSRFDEGIKMDYESNDYFNCRLVLCYPRGSSLLHQQACRP